MWLNKRYLILITLIVAIMVTTGVLADAGGAEEAIKLTKTTAKELALDNSNVIRGLEDQLSNLASQYSATKDSIKMFEELYKLLPRYKELYNKNARTQANGDYLAYFNKSMELMEAEGGITAVQAQIDELTAAGDPEGLVPELEIQLNGLKAGRDIIEAEVDALAATLGNNVLEVITINESFELSMYTEQFLTLGITDPNLSKPQEYETFIYPIEVAPELMAVGVQSMSDGVKVAKESISLGVNQLYDTILMMNGMYHLLETSYKMSIDNKMTAEEKYKQGQLTLSDYKKAQNDMVIAEIELKKLGRQIDNLEMNLKQMLGLDLTKPISLEEFTKPTELLTLQEYLDSALENRSELLALTYQKRQKQKEFEYVEKYYSKSTESYKITDKELQLIEIDIERTKQSIEQEIYNGFLDIKNKRKLLDIKKADLEQAENKREEIAAYERLGFVTNSILVGVDIMVIQKENDYLTANRNYLNALYALEAAKGIGPSYSSQGGGMTIE